LSTGSVLYGGAGGGERANSQVASAPQLNGFKPILNTQIKVLILGSFPSVASLAAGQYYAHPRNQFWAILGYILNEPLAQMSYAQRQTCVLAHHIGIWDVLGACRRRGSLDTAIRQGAANDFSCLRVIAPNLSRVLFNGAAAGKFAPLFARNDYEVYVLPSTSPAHASRSLDDKVVLWHRALESIELR